MSSTAINLTPVQLAEMLRARSCDLGHDDHGHTDCWLYGLAAAQIERLYVALEQSADFACFDPPTDDPCDCCLHVTDIVNGALNGSDAP